MNKPGEAAQELEEAQAIEPADPELLFALASGYLRVKKVEAAERLFARVAAARPQPETYVLIGRTYRDFQLLRPRAHGASRALKMDPRVRRAHYYLGTTALLEEGFVLLDEAIAEFRRELAITPSDPLATLRLGVAARRGTPVRRGAAAARKRGARAVALLRRVDVSGTLPAGARPRGGRRRVVSQCARDGRRRAGPEQSAPVAFTTSSRTALRDSGATAEAEREFAEAQRLSVEQRRERTRAALEIPDRHAGRRQPSAIPPARRSADSRLSRRERTGQAAVANRRRPRADVSQSGHRARASGPVRTRRGAVRSSAAIDPGFPQVQYLARRCLLQRGAVRQGGARARPQALEQQPQNTEASRMLALASLNTGDYAESRRAAAQGSEAADPTRAAVRLRLALVRSRQRGRSREDLLAGPDPAPRRA